MKIYCSKLHLLFVGASRLARACAITLCLAPLAGCVGEKQGLIWDTFRLGLFGNEGSIDSAPLNPDFRYLRAQVAGQSALLVLGYETTTGQSASQAWYSGNGEVLQLQGGRLVGTGGLDINWVDVSLVDAPPITSAQLFPDPGSAGPRKPKLFFFRTRSVMPQYVINVHEAVVMQALDGAPDDAPKILRDEANLSALRWVSESVVLQPNNPSLRPLKATYAYSKDSGNLVYGRQCLTETYCLSWMAWPRPPEAAGPAR